jgi:cation diffusion facilitator CzcD-associated flavoprotein CzcO
VRAMPDKSDATLSARRLPMTGRGNGHAVRETLRTPRVAIIGAGMSGIGMAAKLRMAGIESFRIYEKAPEIGGTWRANTYPGLSCDIPSRYYSYTFAPNSDWSHVYSPGREIWAYLDGVARDFQLRDRITLNTEVAEARWADGWWLLRTRGGEEAEYDFIVTAVGGLVHTVKPDIPGLRSFAGAQFHSAEWDHSVPLEGQRIAVIGTGSTGMQLTRALAPIAGRFELYQRTPQWIFPLANHRYTRVTRWLYRRVPGLSRVGYRTWQFQIERTLGRGTVKRGLSRWLISTACRLHLRSVRDPELRRRLTPDYKPMCKRLLMGTNFYKQFKRPNVELIDHGIESIEPRGIVTRDGRLHELDVIVFATGFDAHAFLKPMELVGADGARLSEMWGGEPYGYRSVALPGFPNVFTLIGPHSPFGNQSLFTISETQMDFAMTCIQMWRRGDVDSMAPTREATDRFNAELRAAIPNTIWASGCKSWYIGKDGLPHAWPWTPERHREMLAVPRLEEWNVERGPARAGVHATTGATR